MGEVLKTVKVKEHTYNSLVGYMAVRETFDTTINRLLEEVARARRLRKRRITDKKSPMGGEVGH